MRRLCVKSGCNEVAASRLTYHYDTAAVWLDDVAAGEVSGHAWDVCDDHADTLRVPRGWTLDDRRSRARPLFPAALAG